MEYYTQDYWIFGLCPSSNPISETLRSLEYRTMDKSKSPLIPTINFTA
jgi:hypothetical protein